MINCIIVDDEQHAIDILTHYVKQTPFLHLLAAATNPLNALQLVHENKVDLVFLDIQMPEISGLDFIKAINGKAKVILTTAYSEFAVEGFELEVLDYLLKPISMPRFVKATQRALNIISNEAGQEAVTDFEDDFILVKTESKGKLLKIMLTEIDYIEGLKNYIGIHHNGQKTMALLNMKDLEERLPKKHFMRIHKSFIVSVNKITALEGNQVILKNSKADILLGESYRAVFFERMKGKIMH
jgi:DNA-binding LytR/AlgR family response regulator